MMYTWENQSRTANTKYRRKKKHFLPLLYVQHLFFSLLLIFISLSTPNVWFFSPKLTNSLAPIGCPTTSFNSETIYQELASGPTSYGLSISISDPVTSSSLSYF